MIELKVTSKGQVTLRKEVLKHLGIDPGGKVRLALLPDGRIEVTARKPQGKISDVFGMLHREDGPRLTIEEISEATARGWAGRR